MLLLKTWYHASYVQFLSIVCNVHTILSKTENLTSEIALGFASRQ